MNLRLKLGTSWALLTAGISALGLMHGIKQWIYWEIEWPIQRFIWLNITHKPWCTYCGYECPDSCSKPKLTKKEDIIFHWEKMEQEAKTVEKGENDMCAYCGEDIGTVEVNNPNMDSLSKWLVCITCDEVIKEQQKMAMGMSMKSQELIDEADRNLLAISKRTGKPSISMIVAKDKNGYKASGIEYTGEEDSR